MPVDAKMKRILKSKIKICTIIGARPQFVKASVVSAAIKDGNISGDWSIEEIIIHTGQHYDKDMSEVFFNELGIPMEKYNLKIGSGSHGEQTGKMLSEIEKVLRFENPDWVLIYGDTNSTLAGALAAVKLHIPVAHVEAGMRSFNKKMPEEINRVVVDHICQLNFCSTTVAMKNLKNEGLYNTAILVGDVMYDCSLRFLDMAESIINENIFYRLNLIKKKYILMTCHRAENTNDKTRLTDIIQAVNEISREIDVLYPMHPRTEEYLKSFNLKFSKRVQIIHPVGYLEMLLLEKESRLILTDSGGIQKEAFFFQVPCVTMRDETEWVETVELGCNTLVGAQKDLIIKVVLKLIKDSTNADDRLKENPYGDGNASIKIIKTITQKSWETV